MKTLHQMVDAFADRATATEKHLMALYQHCNLQAAAMMEYKAAILQLQKEVKDLQSAGTENILLEEKHASSDLGSDDGYRANTNDR